jgi:NAD(P)-dependent dehydrogenase (short-subunit alcohol dehydrogenase family)
MRDFEGKVAVVTGAASGMGRAFAERFAQEGMKVVLADVEAPALETAVAELRQKEHDVIGVLTDVSKAESVENLAQKALDLYGKVHVVCNNAGVFQGGASAMWEWTLKDWQWMVGVNFWGVVHGIRTFVPLMLRQDEEGHIVNTSSLAGLVAGFGIYGTTKHAVVAMSESLYLELKARNAKIGVSVLCPAGVNTNIGEADRNRPQELRNEDGRTDVGGEERARLIDIFRASRPPAEVAEIVLDGIRNDQFYLRTEEPSPGLRSDQAIRTRMENIIARQNPVPWAGRAFSR